MKTALIAVVVLLVPSLALAEPVDSTLVTRPNSLHAGAWALVFDVNGELLNVSSFAGGLSLKRHFSPKSALRFGVSVAMRERSHEVESSANEASDSDEDFQGVSLSAVYLRYLNTGKAVNAYWGLGPTASFSSNSGSFASDSTSTERSFDSWTAGVAFAFGAEWFFARQFSLHTEFTGSGYYFNDKIETDRTVLGTPDQHLENESDGWSVGTSGVRLGLNVYFSSGEGSAP